MNPAGAQADAGPTTVGGSSRKKGSAVSQRTPCIVAVVGSTGTGKSQLAVDLARAVHEGLVGSSPSPSATFPSKAEIISADSMQVYEGLDVITNKATDEEMGGVRHHLMDFLTPGKEYQVLDFVRDAKGLIEEMHSRPQPTLPIIAGGTAYYTQHLLFPGRLIGSSSSPPTSTAAHAGDEATASSSVVEPTDSLGKQASLSFAERRRLDELLARLTPTQRATWDELLSNPPPHLPDSMDRSLLWSTLDALDPDMARRWHWKDGRKVARSLRVLGETGKRHSEWIAEQRKAELEESPRTLEHGEDDEGEHDVVTRARKVVFWVWCEPEMLKKRLDERVDKMVERGLVDEIMALRKIAAEAEERGEGTTDYTRGIYQAIGYKEFDAYLRLAAPDRSEPTAEASAFLASALSQMQTSTRQYAKKQTMWLRRQLVPTLLRDNELRRKRGEEGGGTRVYILDGTRRERWEEEVKSVAVGILRDFLQDKPLPDPTSLPRLSAPAKDLIGSLLADAQREVLGDGSEDGEDGSKATLKADDPIARNALQVCPECTRASTPAGSSSSSETEGDGEARKGAERPFLVRRDGWKAHLGSKKHRSSLKRLKRLEDKRRWEESQAQAQIKAKAEAKDDMPPSPSAAEEDA